MKDTLREMFGQVQAEEALKDKTRMFLARKTKGYTIRPIHYQRLITVAACIVFLCFGGSWFYFTPTAQISIDINPSLELGINRFDKVISVNGYNDEGEAWGNSLHLKFLNYTDALEEIRNDENTVSLLSADEVMTITVVGPESTQSSRILSGVTACMSGQKNTYCYAASSQEVAQAHEMGLSYGKYRAFLQLQRLDPNMTPENVQGMTMREIRDLIDSLSADQQNETSVQPPRGNRYHGNGNGAGHGQKQGKSSGETHKPSG